MENHNSKIPAFLLAGTLIITTGCGAGGNNTAGNNNSSEQGNTITEADARQIALQKAGLETATFTKQEYDSHDKEYEFEFYTDTMEYDCDVNAADGGIRNYSVEERLGFDD
jgi:uncharacterized membrane protein YkoI